MPSQPQDSQISRVRVCNVVLAGQLLDLNQPDFTRFRDQLKKFYGADYALAWSVSGRPTPQARSMIELFQRSDLKGLIPEDYDAPRWDGRLRRVSDAMPSPIELATFDVAVSVSAMRYISDIHAGRVAPREFSFGLSPKNIDLAGFLRNKIVDSGDVKTAFQQLEPGFGRYRKMLDALDQYTHLARQQQADPQPLLPQVSKPVVKGSTYAGAPQLVQRLRLLGDLPPTAQLPPQTDLYDGALVDAVQHFQRRHGLPEDGRITAETVRELNVPISARVTQLKLTIERWRWLPSDLKSPLVVVNIPEFQLRAYSNGRPVFTTRVIVGKAYDHNTPIFADEMEYIIFRPHWNVPFSITRKEIIPALRRNPGYLTKHKMQVVNSQGVPVTSSPDAETLNQVRAGKLEIRQRSGPGNALGLVKFVFPNEYDVYLHGTPERQLFTRSRRDFSHGCIRVEDPEGLAAWALSNDPSWTQERIRAAMYGDRTIQVSLPQHIPVLIFYGTAMVDENGEVRFFQDLYGLDAALQSALESTSR